MRRIAICQDDAGLAAPVVAATMHLALQDRLSAVSCMVAAPDWRAAVPALRTLSPGSVDVGLHLDLVEHVIDPGVRRPLAWWLAGGGRAAAARARLAREIDAQLDAFEQAMGRAPAHVDGHRHVHQCPGVREALLEALHRRPAAVRPWLRSTRRPARGGGWKAALIERLGDAGLRRLAAAEGLRQNGHLLGVYGFDTDAAGYLRLLRGWLDACADGDVLMCHPAEAAPAGDPIGAARVQEFAALESVQFGRMLQDAGVQVLPLSRVLAG